MELTEIKKNKEKTPRHFKKIGVLKTELKYTALLYVPCFSVCQMQLLKVPGLSGCL